MARIVYVNGEYKPESEAVVSVFDRAFLFADAVYEVSSVIQGRLVDNDAHLARLERSCAELSLSLPCSTAEIEIIQRELIKRNGLDQGTVYLQVTRGVADRDFKIPGDAVPGLVMFTQARNLLQDPLGESGIRVISIPDIRWKRRDIKTVGLLASSLAKQQAVDAGADDAWLVEDGYVTEGSSNNAYIVDESGAIVTRHLGNEILHGITRRTVLELCRRDGIAYTERPFTVAEALSAREAFITSASTFVYPVVAIDGEPVGSGKPGPVATRLRRLYLDLALKNAT